MCHWVGVEPDDVPVPERLLRREVEREVGRPHDRLAFGKHRATNRGPQPSEELVHSEWLGEIVVGAEVERFDLGRFGAAAGQHDDRDRSPAAKTAYDIEAVHARKTQIEDDHVGVMAGGEQQRFFTGGRQVGFVSARTEVHFESLENARIVFDDEDSHSRAANVMTTVVPPPGVSSMLTSPPMASTNPFVTASPRPMPS